MPKISVIMPVYNTDKQYLREAIESVLHQTYADFELFLIDDASTNDIQGAISSYKDSRLKYIRLTENHGAAYARNFGIEKASGEFIAFLDSDDVALPHRFAAQLSFFENHPDIGCAGSFFLIIPEGREFPLPMTNEDIVFDLLTKDCVFLQSSVMMRKKVLIDTGISYKVDYVPSEDYAFWIDLIGLCKFANINEILVKYRWHGNNISITQAGKQKALATKIRMTKILALADCSDEKAYNAILNYLETPQLFVLNELPLVETVIPNLVNKMVAMGISEQKAKFFMRKNLTKLMRKVPSKEVVRKLCFSSLNSYLQTGLHRQLFYYVTKGIF